MAKTWPEIDDAEWKEIVFQLEGVAERIRAEIESRGDTTHLIKKNYDYPTSRALILAAYAFTKQAK